MQTLGTFVSLAKVDGINTRAATRLDIALLRKGLVDSREKAAELIRDGKVLVNGAVASKPARQIRAGDELRITSTPRYVSRAGLKLEGALARLGIGVEGLRVLDVGSSTGGFTDCLLSHGASVVFAVDVGTHQLHEKLRGDVRVVSFERTNIRDFNDPEGLGFDLVVSDMSFTSVKPLAKTLVSLTKQGGELLVLVKPQFEVGRRDASRGRGVIRDPALWEEVLKAVAEEFISLGVAIGGLAVSELRGAQGNFEFFFHFMRGELGERQPLDTLIDTELTRLADQSSS